MFVSISDTLEQCLPNVKRATLPAASHGLEMENAEDFNRIVLEFVGRHE
jgi:pimeloyl-ACP methyl ester carboxylesterase